MPVTARDAEFLFDVGRQEHFRGDDMPAQSGRVAFEHIERALEEVGARGVAARSRIEGRVLHDRRQTRVSPAARARSRECSDRDFERGRRRTLAVLRAVECRFEIPRSGAMRRRSCISRSMRAAFPARREWSGERLASRPTSAISNRHFDCAKVRPVFDGARARSHDPSIHDSSLAPPGKHVLSAIVQYAPFDPRASSDTARTDFLERTLDVLERYSPGLRRHVVASEMLLPADIEKEFRITGGHWHHGDTRSTSSDAASGAGRRAVRDAGAGALSLRCRLSSGWWRDGLRRPQMPPSRARRETCSMKQKEHFRTAVYPTPFHPRTSALNIRSEWHRWKDYVTADAYSTRRSSTRPFATPVPSSTSRR